MIKIIIFDFDGVIENTYEKHFQLSKKQFKNLTREEHRELFEGNIYEKREKLKNRDTGFNTHDKMDELRDELIINDEIKNNLIKLSNKYKLGIITSAGEKKLYDYFKRNDLNKIFSFILGFETHKSKVEKFKIVINNYDFKNNEIIFITDTLGDIIEANELKIKTIAVDFGYHENERLKKGNPERIISDFFEIIGAVNDIDKKV
ncbi:HAD family hydrolase [Candidatus Pacearchaeota archaeon]|nr:HAD family hydrolase [Candidatus Pacearchaeota archaeon]